MIDFRLKVFYTVAKRLNFTKAAQELFISQPAVTKHVKELENHLGLSVFDRTQHKIALTQAGEILLSHAEFIMEQYRQMEFDINSLKNITAGALKLGASTTLAQYVLPSVLAMFNKRFPDVRLQLTTANSNQIEEKLLHKNIDLSVVEGHAAHPQLKYIPFIDDELVLVTSTSNTAYSRHEIKVTDLLELPFLMRETDSGTYEVLASEIKKTGLNIREFNIVIELGSTESIKSYLFHSKAFAFLSIHSITNEVLEKKLRIVPIKDFSIKRGFSFVHIQGQPTPLAEQYMRFAKANVPKL